MGNTKNDDKDNYGYYYLQIRTYNNNFGRSRLETVMNKR